MTWTPSALRCALLAAAAAAPMILLSVEPALAQTKARPAAAAPRTTPRPSAPAEPPQVDPDEETTVSEIVINGQRTELGAVVGDIKPEVQLSAADVRSYGVNSVTDLLTELAPQIRSERGRGEAPVVLLDGRRISGFQEIRDIPTEAIARVDILPEEAALKYGYSANQRVVNIVLRPRFRAWTLEGAVGGPTAGGQASGSGEADLFRNRRGARLNLDLKVQGASALTEDQRDIVANDGFDPAGRVRSATPGGQIDPALSALAGRPVTATGTPASALAGAASLADFAAAPVPASDVGRFRTLIPETRSVSANAVLSRGIFWGLSGTLNGSFDASTSEARLGLPGTSLRVPAGDPFSPFGQDVAVDRGVVSRGPLTQTVDSWNVHLGAAANRDYKGWRLNFTSAYDHADSRTEGDAGLDPAAAQALLDARSPSLNPFAPLPGDLLAAQAHNAAHSRSDGLNAQGLASGPVFSTPAGQARLTLKLGDTETWFSSDSQRLGVVQSADLSRNAFNAQANFDLPLASRRNDFLPVLGELSANLNLATDQLSDFGTLNTLGYGLNWRPRDGLSLIVSHTRDHSAPTMQQLGDPVVLTPGARIFDFATGRTVEVTRIDGGTRALLADDRDVLKVGLTFRPWSKRDLTFQANYVESRIENPISSLPAATAEIEAAFPERFQRDAAGNLTTVDFRPINFAREEKKSLRWGFNYSKPIGPQRQGPPPGFRYRPDGAPPPDGARPEGPRPEGGRGGGGDRGPGGGGRGFGGGGFGGAQNGRFQIALYHTRYYEDRITARAGGPVFDLLNGSAMGSGGGQPRDEVELQAGVSERGYGARISADWKSGTEVRGGPSGDLKFSDLTKVNLRLFADLGLQRELVRKHPFLRGSRVTLSVNNLFDEKPEVRDATGATPISYQPDLLDPEGRTVRISFRKLFFPAFPTAPTRR